MIDLEGRKTAAINVRNFLNGRMTNFEFEESHPETFDYAISAIYETAWRFYDDFKEHTLTDGYQIPIDYRKAWIRWIMFLHTDNEYAWGRNSFYGIDQNLDYSRSFLDWLLGRETVRSDELEQFLARGDYEVWPFQSRADYKKALRNPHLLSGRRRT